MDFALMKWTEQRLVEHIVSFMNSKNNKDNKDKYTCFRKNYLQKEKGLLLRTVLHLYGFFIIEMYRTSLVEHMQTISIPAMLKT